MADSVVVADIPLSIFVGPDTRAGEVVGVAVKPYDAIFASYSSRDEHVVERLAHISKIMRLKFLRNVISLKSSQGWSEEKLYRMIAQADIFQLFWSPAAAASPRVTQEWQYALALNRDETTFIRPVYWTLPMPPPPPKLNHLHFYYRPELRE